MVAYGFQKRFIPAIEADEKLQTIRGVRRQRHARRGEDLQLYYAMRTKHCRLIGVRRCLSVHPIIIAVAQGRIFVEATCPVSATAQPEVTMKWADERPIRMREVDVDRFAQRDGFADWGEMQTFWTASHPAVCDQDSLFHGVLIRWLPSTGTAAEFVADGAIAAEIGKMGLR